MDLWFRSVCKPSSTCSAISKLTIFHSYENESALADVHRSTPEYKTMRKTTEDEQLYDTKNRVLIFQEPALADGFLTKDNESMVFSATIQPYVIVTSYTTGSTQDTDILLKELSKIADASRREEAVLTYFPMKRVDGVYTEIIVFERYTSQDGYGMVMERLKATRSVFA